MEYYRRAIKGINNQQLLLGGLFILYSGLDVQAPSWLNLFATSNMGKIFFILLAISLFMYLTPVVAILGLVSIYELLRRANSSTGLFPDSKFNFLPSTPSNCRDLSVYNEYETTLEQEMVQKMAPLTGPSVGQVSYKPNLEDTHDASLIQ